MIQNGGGAIVLMGSDQCFIGKNRSCVYGITKGCIGQVSKSTALDFPPTTFHQPKPYAEGGAHHRVGQGNQGRTPHPP
ncbi:MAG: hypothetical protein ACOYM4_02905 [Nodosilinea sp.]